MNNKSTKSWLPYFVFLSMAWGSTFLFIEVCLEFLTPIGVAFARFSLGALFMLVYITKLKLKFPREKKILLHLFVLSLILNSIFGILLATAQTGVTSVLAGLGASIVPLMTIFFVAVIFRSEPLSFEQLIGLLIGFFGALIIVGVWNGIGDNPWWAMLALLGCTMCYGISYPYTKKYILPNNTVTEIKYPVTQYPKKIKSMKLEKTPIIEGILLGIKGQYLLLDGDRVFNIRSHERFISSFSQQEIAQQELLF